MHSLIEIIDSSDDNLRGNGPDGLLRKLMAEILLLAEEVCVARDQLYIAFKHAKEGSEVTERSVADYEFSDRDIDKRLVNHTIFYEEIFNRLSEPANANDE